VIQHGVESHLPYVAGVFVENGGCGESYSHLAWSGASPAICCAYTR